MNRLLLIAATVLLAGAAHAQSDFGSRQPSADEIVEQLRARPGEGDRIATGRTRSLRPGAAAATQGALQPAPKQASISMQIQFGFNSTRIEGGSLQTMENLAVALASPELKDRRFTIVGHTDGVGSAAYNQRLSLSRARSVQDFLQQRGVDGSRLGTQGKGFEQLLNTADPAAAENRRVEIVATSM